MPPAFSRTILGRAMCASFSTCWSAPAYWRRRASRSWSNTFLLPHFRPPGACCRRCHEWLESKKILTQPTAELEALVQEKFAHGHSVATRSSLTDCAGFRLVRTPAGILFLH